LAQSDAEILQLSGRDSLKDSARAMPPR